LRTEQRKKNVLNASQKVKIKMHRLSSGHFSRVQQPLPYVYLNDTRWNQVNARTMACYLEMC